MNKGKSQFFERLEEIMKQHNLENVTQFANKLGYNASEKLNRLKNPDNKPSVDIILDIKAALPSVDLNWLLGDSTVVFAEAKVPQSVGTQTYLNEYIDSIKDHNKFLQDLVKTNLTGISEQQLVLQSQVQAIQQWDAQIVGKGDKAKTADALGHIHKLTAGNLKRLKGKGKSASEGKKGMVIP